MKIRVKDKSVIEHGKVNLPDVGIVEVPQDGVIDVTDELGEHLIANAPAAWTKHHFQNATANQQAEETDDNLEAEENELEENEEKAAPEVDDNEQRKEMLKKDVETLRSIASALDLPQEEYQDLKKLPLVNYILSKTKDED